MTTDKTDTKRKRITITLSEKGKHRAELALRRMGFMSKSNLAEASFLSRSTVSKFFALKPISLDSFQMICDVLNINWQEVAELEDEKTLTFKSNKQNSLSLEREKELNVSEKPIRQVKVIDSDTEEIKVSITLQGDLNSVANINVITAILKEHSGNTIEITDISKG